MTRFLALSLGASLALATPAAAKVVVADFDELGNLDEVYCGKVENVSYCDVNKYAYGHYGPYLFLSDYDWIDATTLTADPGTYFTPLGFAFRGWSTVWRRPCPECAGLTEPGALDAYLWDLIAFNEGEFAPYDHDFLAVEGYRGGRLVAATRLGGEGDGAVSLDRRFAGIDRLRFDLLGAYFESVAYEEDGYVYTCWFNENRWCNEAVIDDLAFRADVEAPAPIPLPAALPLLLAGLGGLALLRRPG